MTSSDEKRPAPSVSTDKTSGNARTEDGSETVRAGTNSADEREPREATTPARGSEEAGTFSKTGTAHTCPYESPGFFSNCNACVLDMQASRPKGVRTGPTGAIPRPSEAEGRACFHCGNPAAHVHGAFAYCEHCYPSQVNREQRPSEACSKCHGMQILPNQMDAENGPVCACGRPSRHQSGWCGVEHGAIRCCFCTPRLNDPQPDPTTPHLIDGEFQSDKYPTTPRGKVPLSVKDSTAQDLLWEYAQRRREVDAEFAADLETALRLKGFTFRTDKTPTALDERRLVAAWLRGFGLYQPAFSGNELAMRIECCKHHTSHPSEVLLPSIHQSHCEWHPCSCEPPNEQRTNEAQKTYEALGKTAAQPAEVPPSDAAPERKLDEQGDQTREMPGSSVPAEQLCPPAQARESRGATTQWTDKSLPTEVDVDGILDEKGFEYIGKATKQPDGSWQCLANVGGALCRVEVNIAFHVTPTARTETPERDTKGTSNG